MDKIQIAIACYKLAKLLHERLSSDPEVKEMTKRLIGVVGEDDWKLDVLKIAFENAKHRTTPDKCLEEAAEIADFIVPVKVPFQPKAPTGGSKKRSKRR